MKRQISLLTFAFVAALLPLRAQAADPAPLKILLITGGCCHDYAKQKDILKSELEKRIRCTVDQIHTDDKSTKPPLAILGNADYAKGYDLVIHDECAADVKDLATIDAVIKPHLDGLPGVNLHCAMHSYRFGNYQGAIGAEAENSHWYAYLGLHSTAHGAQLPIAITFVDKESPIVKGMEDWTTVKEELYNNIEILGGKALAKGKQVVKDKDGNEKTNETIVAWTNEFGPKKTKVFSTTIGHNNDTVSDAKYMDMITRGVLWACDKIKADGTPKDGYAAAK